MQTLGIDISDRHVTGVLLEQQRKAVTLKACLSLPLWGGQYPAEQVTLLCQQLDWREGVAVCGLPLSLFSVRNVTLPFRDTKKIAQALPFELEEQLLVPVDTLITDFIVRKKDEAGNMVVAFATERAFLENLLAQTRGTIDLDIVTPAVIPLAMQLARLGKVRSSFILIHADQQSSTMVLVLNGQPLFFRHLSYPEQMIVLPPFHFNEGRVEVSDAGAAAVCIQLFCRSIEQSLQYFRIEHKELDHPERIILTGPLAAVESVGEQIAAALSLPVELPDLMAANAIFCPEILQPQWHGPLYDRALALALQGFKRPEVNFRKEHFAKKRNFFKSRRHIQGAMAAVAMLVVSLLGALWYNYHALQQRDQSLGEEMTAIFQQTFPGVTKVRDPFVEMQARVKSATGPASPPPLLQGNKRILGLLADISGRIPATLAVRVNRLAIDRETMAIKGTTDTFNAVETMKSALAASPRFKSVQIVSATADKDKKNSGVRFELQLQLEGL